MRWLDALKPCLPKTADAPGPYLANSAFAAQQKLDGVRVLVRTGSGGTFKAIGRSGKPIKLPVLVEKSMRAIKNEFVFDGELVAGTYHIFDLLQVLGISVAERAWIERQQYLAKLFEHNQIPGCEMVPYAFSTPEKKLLLEGAKAHSLEGIIFKDIRKPYSFGRSGNFLKYKFTKTVDCVVIETGVDGKQNLVLGVYKDGKLIECGHCTALNGDGPSVKVGDVVEVTCLYVTGDDRLYQPTRPMLRTDKEPTECDFAQLADHKTNKTVLTRKQEVTND